MINSNDKPINIKKALVDLFNYSKSHLNLIFVALVLTIIGTIFQIITPNKLKTITDEIASGLPAIVNGNVIAKVIDLNLITKLTTFLIILFILSSIFSFFENFIMATISADIAKNMREDISKKINKLPLKYYDKVSYGDILSRITNDVDTVIQNLFSNITPLIRGIILIIGSLIMMFYNSPLLALTAIISSLFGFFLMGIIMSKSQKYFTEFQEGLGEINGYIEEIYSGQEVVKSYNAFNETKTEFEKLNDQLYTSGWKARFLSGLMMPIMHFTGNFGYVAVCIVGSILVMNNAITFGVIVAFMIYIRLFTRTLSEIAQGMQGLQSTIAASERIFEFLDEKELDSEKNKKNLFKNVKGKVEFKNVRFGYEKNKVVIKNLSFIVEPGQKVAIVGPTGAGKTTIVNLLMRFYELDKGTILIDDIPIDTVPRENVHDQFSMVLQDSWLFEGTIKENIIYSKKNVTDAEVVAACKMVGLDYFIESLPNKYETIIDDRTNLSVGQKQLLTIARAMIQKSPLLILDEATSSVDTRTEKNVQQAMDKLTKEKTSFVIAHRLSTIKNADLILVMKNGDVVESGKHQELLNKNGFYSELYNSQFNNQ